MATRNFVHEFLNDVDKASDKFNLFSKKGFSESEKTRFDALMENICQSYLDRRRLKNVTITTLRSDRTQLRNAVRKRYLNKRMAYTVPDKSKGIPEYSEELRRNVRAQVLVHPVLNHLDISWQEKDEYYQVRQEQIVKRTGKGTKAARDVVMIIDVDKVKSITRKLLACDVTGLPPTLSLILGLQAATGRRFFEIVAAAISLPGHDFEGITERQWNRKKTPISDALDYLPRRTLFFLGQLKTGQSMNPVRDYPIYNLVHNRETLPALDRLRREVQKVPYPVFGNWQRRSGEDADEQIINKIFNSSLAGELGYAAKASGFHECLERNGKQFHKSQFEAKMLRNMYGHILYSELIVEPGLDTDFTDFAHPLYGHTGKTVTAEYKGFKVKGMRYTS